MSNTLSTSARVSSKGWIVIPSPLRRKYDIQPGHEIQIVDYGGVLGLVPIGNDVIREAKGSLAGSTSLTEALLEERRQERSREDG